MEDLRSRRLHRKWFIETNKFSHRANWLMKTIKLFRCNGNILNSWAMSTHQRTACDVYGRIGGTFYSLFFVVFPQLCSDGRRYKTSNCIITIIINKTSGHQTCFACVVSFVNTQLTNFLYYFMNARCIRYGSGMCHFCLFTPIRTKLNSFIWNINFIISSFVIIKITTTVGDDDDETYELFVNIHCCTMHSLLKIHVMFARWCRSVLSNFFFRVLFVVVSFVAGVSSKLTRSKHPFKWIYW